MKNLGKYFAPVVVGVVVLVTLQLFSYREQLNEKAHLSCVFLASPASPSASVPYSQETFNRIEYEAELVGRSDHHGDKWHGDGVATFEGNAQRLVGPVFLIDDDRVRGLSLYRDRTPHEVTDLRIATLNESSHLDWNDSLAYVFFENAADKLAFKFNYQCSVTRGKEA